jgi:hypothetical protein
MEDPSFRTELSQSLESYVAKTLLLHDNGKHLNIKLPSTSTKYQDYNGGGAKSSPSTLNLNASLRE